MSRLSGRYHICCSTKQLIWRRPIEQRSVALERRGGITMLKTALRMACAASVLACLTEPAGAQSVDKRTVFTFSGPVTLPGISLPAGKYEFRLVNATSNANVVQVLNAGGTNPYAMFFSTRVERPRSCHEAGSRAFWKRPPGCQPRSRPGGIRENAVGMSSSIQGAGATARQGLQRAGLDDAGGNDNCRTDEHIRSDANLADGPGDYCGRVAVCWSPGRGRIDDRPGLERAEL